MEITKKRIGICTYWGFGRGMAYLSLCYAKMLKNDFDVYILKLGKNNISNEFNIGVNITEVDNFNVSEQDYLNWLLGNKLDAVILNEYNQWWKDTIDLIELTKKNGIKCYGCLVMEKFKTEQAKGYDKLIAPTKMACKIYRTNGIRNFVYVPFSIDLTEIGPRLEKSKKDKITFLHVGGMLGYKSRKNTVETIRAFIKLNNPNTELIVTSQVPIEISGLPKNVTVIPKDLSRQELIDLYKISDCLIYCAKWDSIGIQVPECLACGTPVIAHYCEPMTEFIIPNQNGLLSRPYDFSQRLNEYTPKDDNINDISIQVNYVDIPELTNKMSVICNDLVRHMMTKNSSKIIETNYNLDKNKKIFIDFLKSELKNGL